MTSAVAVAEQSKVVALDIGSPSQRRTTYPIVRIHLLGSMRATTYLGNNILPRGRKARALLGYLCLAPAAHVSRARLAALLWDRVSATQARNSVRQALSELISAFGPLADELICADRATIKLNLDACWVDALAALAPEQSPLSSLRSELAALCQGELLEDLDNTSATFDQWLLGERARFAQRMRSLLEDELHLGACSGADPKQLIATARRLIALDPTNEGASRVLMRALADMGERDQALREYARCREARRKTGADPSSETRAVHKAIRALSGGADQAGSATVSPTPQSPDSRLPPSESGRGRLRVGVLPFLANDLVNKENLGFSLSQEIAAGLARFRWFDVIAPVSLRRTLSAGFVGDHRHEHGDFDYVVDGAISGQGSYFQISVRLLDLADRVRPVWSERFDVALSELHRLDELVTTRIVARIDPVILYIEGQPKRRERYGATGLLLLAIPMIFSMERKKCEEAGRLISRALGLEPDNAMVEAWAAHWHLFYVGQGWTRDIEKAFAAVQQHALRAITLDPDNAEASGIYAHTCSMVNKNFDMALRYFDRSLRLNPSLAFIWALSAATYCYIGEPDIALQRLERYRELAPPDPYHSWCEAIYTIAYTFMGDYERAVLVGRRAVKANPDFVGGYRPLVASLGHLDRRDEAQPYVRKLLSLDPTFTVERFGQVYPIKNSSDRERYMAGLRLAGVPER
jgi:DNA-binding SARP family transcriptional activator/TolB-like protein